MRLTNRNKLTLYQALGTFMIMLVLFGAMVFLFEYFRVKLLGWKAYFLLIIPLGLFIIYYLRGRPIFEFDSEGEALNFKNRHTLPFLYKELNDEFPKYKLHNYEVINGLIFKRLYVRIHSKKSHFVTLKYDVSYLSNKEIRDLKYSLNKVVKNNKNQP